MEEKMTFKFRHQGSTATPEKVTLMKNLAGALMILSISILTIFKILAPDLVETFNIARISKDFTDWIAALGSCLIVGILIVFPIMLIFQGVVYYQNASTLDRTGILTKGYIMDKWVDISNHLPVCHVRYRYLLRMSALQTVSKELFQRLNHGQDINVLHLEDAPHISRLAME